MKGLVGLVVVGLLACVGTWFVIGKLNEDPGANFALAYGNKNGETIEMHVAIPIGLPLKEGPRLDIKGNPQWEEWVTDHFSMVSDSGEPVEVVRLAHSTLIPEHKVGGAPEFYLQVKALQIGKKYKFDYIPYKAKKNRYRMEFTAPPAQSDMKRQPFELAKS